MNYDPGRDLLHDTSRLSQAPIPVRHRGSSADAALTKLAARSRGWLAGLGWLPKNVGPDSRAPDSGAPDWTAAGQGTLSQDPPFLTAILAQPVAGEGLLFSRDAWKDCLRRNAPLGGYTRADRAHLRPIFAGRRAVMRTGYTAAELVRLSAGVSPVVIWRDRAQSPGRSPGRSPRRPA